MKNIGAFFILFFVLLSCNIPEDEKTIPTNKLEALISLGEVDSTKKEPETKPHGKILLIARGSEPGWYAEFSSTHLRLLINNGTDSLHLDNDFSNVVSDSVYKKTIIEASSTNGKGASMSLVIKIDVKPCIEMSGEKRDKSITLRYNNQNFKGCATSASR